MLQLIYIFLCSQLLDVYISLSRLDIHQHEMELVSANLNVRQNVIMRFSSPESPKKGKVQDRRPKQFPLLRCTKEKVAILQTTFCHHSSLAVVIIKEWQIQSAARKQLLSSASGPDFSECLESNHLCRRMGPSPFDTLTVGSGRHTKQAELYSTGRNDKMWAVSASCTSCLCQSGS